MRKAVISIMSIMLVLSVTSCREEPEIEKVEVKHTTVATTETTEEEFTEASQWNMDDDETEETLSTTEVDPEESAKVPKAVNSVINEDQTEAVIVIKTNANLDTESCWLGLCPEGCYLKGEEADSADVYQEGLDRNYDKEWLEGYYCFTYQLEDIENGDYTMVLVDKSEEGTVVGEWKFSKASDNSVSMDFDNAWLEGAGKTKKIDSYNNNAALANSWFTCECNEETVKLAFSGFYLPQGEEDTCIYVCPQGDYANGDKAAEVAVADSSIVDKCPYIFSLDNNSIAEGEYSVLLCDGNGNVILKFDAVKDADINFTLNFENVKMSESLVINPRELPVYTIPEVKLVWPSDLYPQPENCTMLSVEESYDSYEVMVEWADEEAMLSYVETLAELEIGDGEALYDEENLSYEYCSDVIEVYYDGNEAERNYVKILLPDEEVEDGVEGETEDDIDEELEED